MTKSAATNRVLFGFSHFSRSLIWSTVDLLLAWHLHREIGLSGFETSVVLFVFLGSGAAANLLIGWWLYVTDAHAIDYVRLQRPAALAAAFLFLLQFLVTSHTEVIIYGLLFRIAFAAVDIPQNALASLICADTGEAGSVARLRVSLSAVARLAVMTGYVYVTSLPPPKWEGLFAPGLATFAMLMAASAIALFALRFPVSKDRLIRHSPWPPASLNGLVRLVAGFLFAGALLPTASRLFIFLPPDAEMASRGGMLLLAFSIGAIVGPFFALRVTMRNRPLGVALGVAFVVAVTGFGAMASTLVSVQCVAAAFHGAILNAVGAALWRDTAVIAMVEAENGRSVHGLIFALIVFTCHLAIALGAFLFAPLIEQVEGGSPVAMVGALSISALGALGVILSPVRQKTIAAAP